MSTALTSTANRLGTRTLAAYRPRGVYRSPAEAPPRAGSSVQNVRLGALPNGVADHVIRIDRTTTYFNGSASQSPTGSVSNSNDSFGTPPAVPVTQTQAPTPTSVATVTPAPASGTQVITSSGGGGVVAPASENYVSEIENWLTSTSILQSISPSLAVPNWVPLLGALALVGTFWGGSSGRRR